MEMPEDLKQLQAAGKRLSYSEACAVCVPHGVHVVLRWPDGRFCRGVTINSATHRAELEEYLALAKELGYAAQVFQNVPAEAENENH